MLKTRYYVNDINMTKIHLAHEYETLIFTFRGIKVMIDYDLSLLYNVPTKRLKEQVKRNLVRFPEDFMFVLSDVEKSELVANCDRLASLKHSSVLPMAFTEQGVAMLSSILRSEEAIRINIEIMRAFTRYRAFLKENIELRNEIKSLDNKLNASVKFLIQKLDALHQKNAEPRIPNGFKTKNK